MNKRVVITDQLEGFHNWPEAKDILPEMSFLSDRHRHMFHFRIELNVNHGDRDIEFIKFKRAWKDSLEAYRSEGGYYEFGRMSCEDIANDIHVFWSNQGLSIHRIEVWEDGENGAILEA